MKSLFGNAFQTNEINNCRDHKLWNMWENEKERKRGSKRDREREKEKERENWKMVTFWGWSNNSNGMIRLEEI